MTAGTQERDLSNAQGAGRNGSGEVSIAFPRARMTRQEALAHAAWLVLLADDDDEFAGILDAVRNAATPGRETLFPCCRHCDDGDGMLPCGDFHDEARGTGDCGLVTDAELAEWRKGLQL